ncbi:MAG: hypothetical protein L0177_18675 [Chloroflexi bacterium]|nr:hypothetical protein [Chloroflexota bacterium]
MKLLLQFLRPVWSPLIAARVGELTPRLRRQLGWRFRLDNDTLSRLRFVSKRGHYAGERAFLIRVFDPSLSARAIRRFNDLDDYPAALLFEGSAKSGLLLHVSDMRPPRPVPTRQRRF